MNPVYLAEQAVSLFLLRLHLAAARRAASRAQRHIELAQALVRR